MLLLPLMVQLVNYFISSSSYYFCRSNKWNSFQCQLCDLNYKIVPIGNKAIIESFIRNKDIFELIGIDILIEHSQ